MTVQRFIRSPVIAVIWIMCENISALSICHFSPSLTILWSFWSYSDFTFLSHTIIYIITTYQQHYSFNSVGSTSLHFYLHMFNQLLSCYHQLSTDAMTPQSSEHVFTHLTRVKDNTDNGYIFLQTVIPAVFTYRRFPRDIV